MEDLDDGQLIGDNGDDSGHVPDKFTAGFRLLDKFGAQWKQIHRISESNVNKARRASLKLDALDKSCDVCLANVDHFITSFRSVSNIADQIDNISNDLRKLEDYFNKIEDCLLLLRLRREQMFAEKFIRNVEGNHEAQVQLVKIQAELRQDRLMSEHLQRVQNFEDHIRK